MTGFGLLDAGALGIFSHNPNALNNYIERCRLAAC